jgi:(p)ppGpp synthase/HD superfamily hydrolase
MSKGIDQAVFSDFVKALAFASRKHSQQRRKDAEVSPYINHPIALASILVVEAGIADRDTLCAALLHDTIEDTDTSVEELVHGICSRRIPIWVVRSEPGGKNGARNGLRPMVSSNHLSHPRP